MAHWNALATQYQVAAEVMVVEPGQRNAALRAARGEFVLCTQTNVRFSNELFAFLAARRLVKGRLYRIDCYQGDWLHAREGSFRLTADGWRANAADDITPPDSGIHFGEGWFPPEGDGEVFRWMAGAGEVNLRAGRPGAALELELEPGPGAGALPQTLHVVDPEGTMVAEFAIAERTTVRLWLPEDTRAFRLVAEDGGLPLLDDLRILDVRCFRCEWARPAGEQGTLRDWGAMRPTLVRQLAGGARLRMLRTIGWLRAAGSNIFGLGIEYWGEGWHRLEESGTEKFHWAAGDAELVVRIGAEQQDLCLVVEPGPSLSGLPFELVVRLEDGPVIGAAKVKGVTPLRIPLPLAPGSVAKLLLAPDREGKALPGDTRMLNFRVLACACRKSATAALPMKLPRQWISSVTGERSVGIDWETRLAGAQAQRREIGRPAFLHVNACDFVLMDRERWLDLRGYPETGELPEHRDALLCYSAYFAGAEEEVLRLPLRMTRAEGDYTPAPLDEELVWLITQMRRLHTPVILNVEGWDRGD
ncbi:MAG: hypothetical protein ABI759_08955 [Candidatus Solibacter sp.]